MSDEPIRISIIGAEHEDMFSDMFDWDSWSAQGPVEQHLGPTTFPTPLGSNDSYDPFTSTNLLFSEHNTTDVSIYQSFTSDNSQNLDLTQLLPFAPSLTGGDSPHSPLVELVIPGYVTASNDTAALHSALSSPSPSLLSPASSSSLSGALGPPNQTQIVDPSSPTDSYFNSAPHLPPRPRAQSVSLPQTSQPATGRRPRGNTLTERPPPPPSPTIEERDWSSAHHGSVFNSNSTLLRSPSIHKRSPGPYHRPLATSRHRSGSDVSTQSHWSGVTSGGSHASGSGSLPPPSPSPSPSISVRSLTESASGFKEVVASDAIKAAGAANRRRQAIFHCDLCPSSFTARQRLNTHKNSHYGIRNHECAPCNQWFGQLSDLKRHERSKKHQATLTALRSRT